MQTSRDAAATGGDHAKAVAYDDEMLDYFVDKGAKPLPPPYDDSPRKKLRAQRQADYAALVADTLAKEGPITDANADHVFGVLLALRAETKKPPPPRAEDLAAADQAAIAPALVQVAAPMWKRVDAAVASGELGAAMVRGTTVAEQLPPDSAYAGKLAAIAAQAQARYAALAAKATPDQFAARILHQRLVAMFGGTAPVAPADTDALERQTMLSWTVAVENPCGDLAKRMADEYRASKGMPAKLVVTLASCATETQDLPDTEEDKVWTHQVTEDVPVASARTLCSSQLGAAAPETVNDDQGHHGTYMVQRSYDTCHEQTDFHGDTQKMTIEVKEIEQVTIHRHEVFAAARGKITIELADGQIVSDDVVLRESGGIDTAFTSVHVGEKKFGAGFEEGNAYTAAGTRLIEKIDALTLRANEVRAKPFVTAGVAAAAAGDVQAADQAFFLAGEITRHTSPELLAYMAKQHQLGDDVVAAALIGTQLPRLALSAPGPELPAIPAVEVVANQKWAWDTAVNSGAFAQILDLSLLAGVMQTTGDGIADTSYGAVGKFHVFVLNHGTDHWRRGFGFAFGGGKGTHGAKYLDLDAMLLGGLLVGPLAIEPLVGVGADISPGYQDYPKAPPTLIVPLGAYAEVGARTMLAVPPFFVTVMGTIARRTSDSVPVERRLDIRLFAIKLSFGLRIATYDGDATHIGGKQVWFMAGL